MLMFAPYFWPAVWVVIGTGAVLTAALCLVIAIAPTPHPSSRTHRAGTRGSRPYHGARLAHRM